MVALIVKVIWLPAVAAASVVFTSAVSAWVVIPTEAVPVPEPPSSAVAFAVLDTVPAAVVEATW